MPRAGNRRNLTGSQEPPVIFRERINRLTAVGQQFRASLTPEQHEMLNIMALPTRTDVVGPLTRLVNLLTVDVLVQVGGPSESD